MKVLISPISLEEAIIAAKGGADIIDVKNTREGSLGANFPWIVDSIANHFSEKNVETSATIGDLNFKPGTAAMAAYGAACCKVNYVKAGLFQVRHISEGIELGKAVVKAINFANRGVIPVLAGYADFDRIDGISPNDLVQIASIAKANMVMLDTCIKDGNSLFDCLEIGQIRDFISNAHQKNMKVALAGSIKTEHLDKLSELNPDIIGIRGAVCHENDRGKGIQLQKVRNFMDNVRSLQMNINV